MTDRFKVRTRLLGLVPLLLLTAPLHAQVVEVPESGPAGGMATTGLAREGEAWASAANPAAMAGIQGVQLGLSGAAGNTFPEGMLRGRARSWTSAVGTVRGSPSLVAAYGLRGVAWGLLVRPVWLEDAAAGSVRAWAVQPTVAVAPGRLSFGAGVQLVGAWTELRGGSAVAGPGVGVGAHLGVQYRLSSSLHAGAAWRTPALLAASGGVQRMDFRSAVVPGTASAGAAWMPLETARLEWEGWLASPGGVSPGELVGRSQGDRVGVRAGVEQVLFWVVPDLVVRAGARAHGPLPLQHGEGPRAGFNVGAGWRFFGLGVDAGWTVEGGVPARPGDLGQVKLTQLLVLGVTFGWQPPRR